MAFNLTVHGTPTFAAAKFGNGAGGFSASNYLATTSGPISSGVLPTFRVDFWINTTNTTLQRISGQVGKEVIFGISNGKLAINLPGFGWQESSIAIADGLNHHVAYTYNASTHDFFMWADGARDTSGPRNTAMTITTAEFSIGTLQEFLTGFWIGWIDELAVANNLTGYTGTTYTVPTAAYTGSESNIIALYHLEADGTDSAGAVVPITAGAITANAATSTSITPQLSSITGGTAPYSTQFQSSTTTNGTYTNLGSPVAGANPVCGSALTGLGPSMSRFFRAVVTDSAGTPQVVTFPSSSTGTSLTSAAGNSSFFAFDAPSDNSLGTALNGTFTWGNRKVTCNGVFSWINRLVTGTDCVFPSYIAAGASDIQITVSAPDGSGAVTTTPTLTTGSEQHNANIPVFSGLTSDTAKLVVMRFAGSGNQSFDGDQLFKVTAIGTPACTLPAGHGEVIRMNALPSYVAREGVGADGGTLQTASGYQMVNSAINGIQIASLKHRLRGNITDYWVAVYGDGAVHHLNRCLGTGSTPGVPLDSGNTITDASTGNIQNWLHIATSLPIDASYIYELTAALPAGILLAAIMVGGGTGIDHTATGLKRPLKYVGLGDSTMNAVDGTNGAVLGRPDLGVLEWFSQNENCQVINGGLRGTTIQDWNSNSYWGILSHLPSAPSRAVMCFLGVNDVNSGRTVAQLSADYLTGMAAARAQLASVPLLFQSINPCSSHTWAFYHNYNVGNGTDAGIQGDVTARRSGGDLLTYYLNIEAGGLADPSYSTGGTFNTSLFYDFVHLNPAGQIVHAQLVQAAINTLLATSAFRSLAGRTSSFTRRGSRSMV